MTSTAGAGRLRIHTSAIAAEWIDYNGHLRDACYGLIVSAATDKLMEHLGIDEHYRVRTCCTLYTLESHMHFLHEVKGSDTIEVRAAITAADRKRLLAAFELYSARYGDPVATAEVMLLHVRQAEPVRAEPFPPEIAAHIAALHAASAAIPPAGPRSRRMELPA